MKTVLFILFLLLMFELLFRASRRMSNSIDDDIGIKGKIVAVIRDGKTGRIKKVIEANNIVTDAGDVFYAQKGAGEVPANAFANLVLGSTATPNPQKTSTYSSITPIANTNKAPATGYPKTNDTDTDNSGRGVKAVTWKYIYAAADFSHSAITEGVITIASPTTGSPCLCHFSFGGAFEKTLTDTLTIYVNHTKNGI